MAGVLAASAGMAGAETLPGVEMTVVMSGLHSPRGLAWGPEGGLYVAEAGSAQLSGPCTDSEGDVTRGQNCYSGTGAISRLWRGHQERVASGLPSIVNTGDGVSDGPEHLAFSGASAYVTIGWGGSPSARAGLGELGRLFGALLKVEPGGPWRVVADVSAYEAEHNPAGGRVDSNPYGVLAEPGQRFVTDAGANTLLKVAANGTVSLVAAFPPLAAPPPFGQSDAVPTNVRRGPDGALYVSLLTGAPFLPGAASIWRLVPGQAPQVAFDGLTAITDFAFGPDGSVYVVEYSSDVFLSGPSALVRIAPDGVRTVLTTDLVHPSGIAVGVSGDLYVSNNGGLGDPPGQGEVVRIRF
jgi:hypothetical protein